MSIRVKKPVCIGLDVHRNNVWACTCIKDPSKKQDTLIFKTRKFKSNHTDLVSMCQWIQETIEKTTGLPAPDSIDVYMESTGKYSTPVFNVCEEMGFLPHIVNPKHVRTIAGQKTDQKDCAWIAELGINGLLRSSYIPDPAIRQARRLSRTRTKLVRTRADDIRRIQNTLTEANVRMDLVFSGVDGESARKVVTYLLETDEPILKEVQARIHRSCRINRWSDAKEREKKEEELLKAFSGAKFSFSQKYELRSAYARLDGLAVQIQNYEIMMTEILSPFKSQLELLMSIPGISRLSAMQILSEIGADMSPFSSEKQFISWCGLCPQSNQSNNKHKSVKIGKGGYYLKPVLIQCALNAIRHPYYAGKYKAIAARRGNKRALIAIARKMMTAAYHMLMSGELFCPRDTKQQTAETDEEEILEEQAEQTEKSQNESKATEEVTETAKEILSISKENPILVKKIKKLLRQVGVQLSASELKTVEILPV